MNKFSYVLIGLITGINLDHVCASEIPLQMTPHNTIDELFCDKENIEALEACSSIHKIQGTVEHGQKLGRQLGFPTANIYLEPIQIREGLYRAITTVQGESFLSFAYYNTSNIYNKPLLEVHFFDYSEDLYGKSLDVKLTHYIRPPIPFISNQQMSQRMQRDVEIIGAI